MGQVHFALGQLKMEEVWWSEGQVVLLDSQVIISNQILFPNLSLQDE